MAGIILLYLQFGAKDHLHLQELSFVFADIAIVAWYRGHGDWSTPLREPALDHLLAPHAFGRGDVEIVADNIVDAYKA